jgi:hypothetical protein
MKIMYATVQVRSRYVTRFTGLAREKHECRPLRAAAIACRSFGIAPPEKRLVQCVTII